MSETQRLNVRTTVTLPDLECDGLVKRGEAYIAQTDVVRWLELTAATFDRAHAAKDIGNSIRVCAAEIKAAKVG